MNIIFLIILLILQYPRTSTCSPIELDKLVVMPPDSRGIVIRLQRVEKSGKRLTCVISQLPAHGTLYQLSNVYSSHGYEPIQGTKITTNHTTVTGSNNRVYYKPRPQRVCSEHADSFAYTVFAHAQAQAKGDAQAKGNAQANNPQQANANNGTITIVNTDGTIVCSDFLLGPDDWTIVGNKARISAPIYEPYSRNNICNHYIYATDNHINVPTNNPAAQRDKALWYFNAPSKMLGNMGIAYGGYISFTISIFAGDLKHMNQDLNLVELECSRCGYNVGYSMPTDPIINNMASFKIELTETSIWQKVTQDTTASINRSLSKREFIEVLSQLSGLRILGDLTQWTETVALDNVYISNNKSYTFGHY